jgi:hypothetical protein
MKKRVNESPLRFPCKMEKRGQVWVETVIYTLIALVLIGAVLAIALPNIEKMKDQAQIEKSVAMMKDLDSTITLIGIPGNKRIIEIGLKSGDLKIDGIEDKIVFSMETEGEYSEVGEEVVDGKLIILTEKKGGANLVTVTLDYASKNTNLTYDDEDMIKSFSSSGTSYNFVISKRDLDENIKTVINFGVQ